MMTAITCLCIGDLHFQETNVIQIDELVEKTLALVNKLDPTFIVVLGDVLHTNEKINVTPFIRATDFISSLSEIARTYVLIGNHDYRNASQYLTNQHAFNALKKWDNVCIADTVVVHEYDLPLESGAKISMRFGFTPYVPTGRFIEALGTEMWETCEAIFAHQEIKGCKLGGKISECSDEWDAAYPLLISGHIHEHHVVGPNVVYTGSAMQHGVDDDGSKYLLEFSFTGGGEWTVNKHDLNLKRKKRIHVDVEDVETLPLPHDGECILTLNVSATSEQYKRFKSTKKYRELSKRGILFSHSPRRAPLTQETEMVKEMFNTNIASSSSKALSFIEILTSLIESESEIVKTEFKALMKGVKS